jgi:hypothetical protein
MRAKAEANKSQVRIPSANETYRFFPPPEAHHRYSKSGVVEQPPPPPRPEPKFNVENCEGRNSVDPWLGISR